MADMSELAAALYPNLPSAAAPAAPATPPARPREGGERSTAEAIYGTDPGNGLTKARESIASGIARPAGEPASAPERAAPAKRDPPSDWLTTALKEQAAEREPEAPESVEVAAPSHLVDRFHEMAADAGLSEDRSAAMMKLHEEALISASAQYWDTQSANWERQTRRQFGARLDTMVSSIRPLLGDDKLTTPGFRRLLDEYRLGNNPDVVRTLANFAAAIKGRR